MQAEAVIALFAMDRLTERGRQCPLQLEVDRGRGKCWSALFMNFRLEVQAM